MSIDRSAYVTPDDIWRLAELKGLVDLIMKESNEVLNFYKVKRDSHYVSNMWANITHPNHRHHLHIHPNCLLSGILYVTTPKDCGPTVFDDPRPGARIIEPQYTEMTAINSNRFVVAAEKGRLLIAELPPACSGCRKIRIGGRAHRHCVQHHDPYDHRDITARLELK